ncbi:MAG: nucleoside 2-deoxyribosyltransferase [Candidatus Dojkabacteria bacterium]
MSKLKIYFAASTAHLDANKKRFDKILNEFKRAGHDVLESWIIERLEGKTNGLTPQELLLKNLSLLQDADLVVVELSQRSFGVGYQYGQALANRKRVLVLSPEDIEEEKISDIVKGSTSSLVTLLSYSDKNIDKVVRDYLAGLSMDDLRKFNFIATDDIVRFIEEGADREGKSKSEFLRDKIANELIGKK